MAPLFLCLRLHHVIFQQYAYIVFLLLQVITFMNKYSIVCFKKIEGNIVGFL